MFKRILLLTIVAVFFLIFIGGFVRSAGAGMGCPDWPKCFGSIIPPSSENELPSDYIELYKEIRLQKNLRLEKLFSVFGLENVLHDRELNHTTYVEVKYDFSKAWIEYLNRVIGVLVGFLVLGVFIFSFKYWKDKKWVVFLSFLSLVILLIEAFLGSVVVSTNLFPELISVHMVLALILAGMLIFLYFKLFVKKSTISTPKFIAYVASIAILFSFIQMFMGIQVREIVDTFHNEKQIYSGIIENLGLAFYVHRTFSVLVLLINIWLIYLIGRYGVNNKWSRLILPIIGVEIFTGMTLANFDLPPISQPFHLLLGSLLIGMQFLNFLYLKFATSN